MAKDRLNACRAHGCGDTGWLPALALAGVIGLTGPAAIASGTGSRATTGTFPGLPSADGFYYATYGPDPVVDSGVRSMTHGRVYFNRAAYHFDGVGFLTLNNQSTRRLSYQVSDANGNYIYYLGSPTYQPYDAQGFRNAVSAGMWRTTGNTWHFNWWGPGFNVGVDIANTAGANNPDEAALGADGWGGCRNDYPVNDAWNWIYRNKTNGSWYYLPGASNFNWGNTPTWFITGGAANGGAISFGTVSCP